MYMRQVGRANTLCQRSMPQAVHSRFQAQGFRYCHNGSPYGLLVEDDALLLVRAAIGVSVAQGATPADDDAAPEGAASVAATGARLQIAFSCTTRRRGWHTRNSSTDGRVHPTMTGPVNPNALRTRSVTCPCPTLQPLLSNACAQFREHKTSRIASQMLPIAIRY